MTSPFTGEFCEVRELQRGGERKRETGRRGKGHQQACRMFFEEKQLRDGTHSLLLTGLLFCERVPNKLADCTAQWADVAHIQLDSRMHNLLVVYINEISPVS